MNQPLPPPQHQPPMPYYWYPPQPSIAPKNPVLHAVVSAFVPGVGSMMAEDIALGVTLLLSLWIGAPMAWLSLFVIGSMGEAGAATSIVLWFLLVFVTFAGYIAAIWHGHHAATQWNRRRGVTS